ncbi:MAG: hypothetical protein H6607_04175 [Flavobacteriales bacterium]|nr:hypothetical protein [Flavobacteriales bacterium]
MPIRRGWLAFGLFLASMPLMLWHCNSHTASEQYLNLSDSAHYVGMEVCATCHADKAQTFVHTGMGLSFDTVSKQKSSARLTSHHVLYDSFQNYFYYPYWRGDRLFIKEFRLNGKDTTYQRTEEISYIIGSGQHTNSHLIKKGNYVVQAPFTWYAQKQKLDFPPGFENGHNSRFSRVIDEECMTCHNSLPSFKPNSTREFMDIPKGIGCERCHGPGSFHVDFRRNGNIPNGDIDYTIVNPSKLSLDRQIDVCQRCHLQGNNVLKPQKRFSDFRPGMVLSDIFEVYLPQYEDDEQLFNMANHADRMQNSACFKKSKNLTCITCHNPHISVKQTNANHFISICEGCHTSKNTCTEQLKIRTLKGDDCIVCHMPASGSADIPHVSVHDHKIAIHNKIQEPKPAQNPVGLYCVNNQNPDAESLIKAYLTYYEKFEPNTVYQKKAEELLSRNEVPELQIHLLYQKGKWGELVEYANNNKIEQPAGVTCYRIGVANSKVGNYKRAVEWLQLAVLKQPDYFEYKSDLGSNLIKINHFSEAEKILLEAYKQFEEYNPTLNNLGFLYINLAQFKKAQAYLEKSLLIDNDNIIGIENMILLYSQQNNREQEIAYINRLLMLKPNHAAAKQRLAELRR